MPLRLPRSLRRLDLFKGAVVLLLALAAIGLIASLSYSQQLQILPGVIQATPVPRFTAAVSPGVPTLAYPAVSAPITAGRTVISGTARPGLRVQVLVDGQIVGETMAADDGQWRLAAAIDTPGTRLLRLQALDAAGEIIAQGEPVPVQVVTPAPMLRMPVLSPHLIEQPPRAGIVVLTGSGQPNSTVRASADGQPLGVAPVDAGGVWTITADIRAPGFYQLGLEALDDQGQVAAVATPVRLQVSPPSTPILFLPPTPTIGPSPQPAAVVNSLIVAPGTGASRVSISGTGDPNTVVQIALADSPVATTTIGASGAWSVVAQVDARDAHKLSVWAIPPLGAAISVPVALPAFVLAQPLMAATPTVPAPSETPAPQHVAPGISGLSISSVDGRDTLRVSGVADANGLVQVRLGATPVATVTASIDGAWSAALPLAGGGRSAVQALALSDAGELLAASAPFNFEWAPTPTPPLPPPTATFTATSTPTPPPTSTGTSMPTSTPTSAP